MSISEMRPRLTLFLKVFGAIFLVLGLMVIYYNNTSPEIGNPDRTFFNGLGLAQTILGILILLIKVRE